MSGARPRPRWQFLLSPRWLTWHAFILVSAGGMLLLGGWQLHRAQTGNALSWAYTFEWPVFAIFVVIFWGKTIFDEGRHPRGAATHAEPSVLRAGDLAADDDLALPGTILPRTAHTAETDDEAADDPELAAYNAYLARLNRREEAGSAP
ncbi:MAG TPA: hypothetical protein VLM11_16795 [Streptosporangiaceae bacterium]|nr:hypothetical protein [Streptosporangiaceae bacterium]